VESFTIAWCCNTDFTT